MDRSKVIGTLVVVIVFLLFGVWGITKLTSHTVSISSTGNGKVSVKAAWVSLVISQVSANTNVATAINDNETSMTQLIALAKRYGGDGVEIKKSFYQITPQNDQFLVANALSLKTNRVADINSIIKDFYAAGATSVSNVTFLPSDEVDAEQTARLDAIKKARANGEKMAAAAGKHLGQVLSVTDDQTGASSTVSDALGNDSQLTVTKSVTVAYEIW